MQDSPRILTKYRNQVEEYLQQISFAGEPGLSNIIQYHLGWADKYGNPISSFQGKGIRSSLCMFTCEAVGGLTLQSIAGAAAIELVHNFSLIHDDIQDGDEERRHRSTLWSIWGVPVALQVGNYMRILADLSIYNPINCYLDPDILLKSTEILTGAYLETVEGQYLDLSFEGRADITISDYLDMINRKTGALISCALHIGSIAGTKDKLVIEGLARLGRVLGIIFQIRDDYLGVWGSEKLTGKSFGSDIRRKKNSLPIVHTLQEASNIDRGKVISIFSKDFVTESDVLWVLSLLDKLKTTTYIDSLAEMYASKAMKELEELNIERTNKSAFEELIDFLINRQT